MASQIPEARSLASWEDAFQHPLPVVRKLEQQLRRNIEENRQKLRSLVGASYRDLLGTAERIVEMDEQIQSVETHLGDMGRKCNARMVERIGNNHARLMKERGVTDQTRFRTIAQTKVLQSTLAVTLRIVKSNGNALLASKLLVLARLLHKSLAEQEESPQILESLAKKARLARKKLISYIGRTLVRVDEDKASTVQKLCAYSLISSSSPRDVLRYFLQVRFGQLELKTDAACEEDLLVALDLYRRTLSDTRELFPKRFADALSQVSEAALIRDPTIRAMSELSLDVYEQWIAEDVRKFMPWTHHEQVTLSEVKDALSSWARQAQTCFLHGLGDFLETQTDPQKVLGLRQQVLSQYLSLSVTFRDANHVHAIDQVRAAFLARIQKLADDLAEIPDLKLSSTSVGSRKVEQNDMWDLAQEKFELERGAMSYRQAILDRQHGRTPAIQATANSFDEWSSRLERATQILATLRNTRWDDDVDLDLDAFEDGESIISALSKLDPQHLETKLQDAATSNLRAAYDAIQAQASTAPGTDAVFYIRVFRELDLRRRRLSAPFPGLAGVTADKNVINALHRTIAGNVSEEPLSLLAGSARRGRSYTPTSLWEGNPALPIQPSPRVFRFLTTLHRRMSSGGVDIWSAVAVQVLKARVVDQLMGQGAFSISPGAQPLQTGTTTETINENEAEHSPVVEDPTPSDETTEGNGTVATDLAGSAQRDRVVQDIFDALYLQRVLGTANRDGKPGAPLQEAIQQLAEHLAIEVPLLDRLRKNANDYWRRTTLLFGLLAA